MQATNRYIKPKGVWRQQDHNLQKGILAELAPAGYTFGRKAVHGLSYMGAVDGEI